MHYYINFVQICNHPWNYPYQIHKRLIALTFPSELQYFCLWSTICMSQPPFELFLSNFPSKFTSTILAKSRGVWIRGGKIPTIRVTHATKISDFLNPPSFIWHEVVLVSYFLIYETIIGWWLAGKFYLVHLTTQRASTYAFIKTSMYFDTLYQCICWWKIFC